MAKYILLVLVSCLVNINVLGQSFNKEQIALKNFLVRMYKAEPIEGVQIVQDYKNYYLISVVTLARKNGVSNQSLNRVAQVKSQRQVAQYFNAHTQTSTQTIIKMSDDIDGTKTVSDVVETVSEVIQGNIRALSPLTTIDNEDKTERVYIFYRTLDEIKP
jgi:hypothetical protein